MKKHILLIVLSLLLCLYCMNAVAVPAYPYKISVSTFNGKTAFIYMRGDEFQKFAISEDGYTLLNDSDGWWYATVSENEKVSKSSFRLMAEEDECLEIKNFKKICPKGLVPERIQLRNVNNIIGDRETVSHNPMTGERRSLVILMQYKDLPFSKTKEDFETLFNNIDYYNDDVMGSVRDFYQFASQGQLDYISDLYGPFTSKYPMKYYGENSTYGGHDSHSLELCIEAVKNLPSNLDYTLYDNNNDGLVDNVHIIFAGYGEEAGGGAEAIWSHEYPYRINLKNEIGYSLACYSCSPELKGNTGRKITNIGVICHELGHALGAMDYYDTNYENGGEYVGTGKWDIMADGSWNDDGRLPANFNPYVRSYVFQWSKPVVLEPNQHIVIPSMEYDNAEQSIIYRINTECEGDYFLLENRQRYGFDSALPGEGLMIYHVHPNIERYNATNTVNATHPQGFYPICASYSDAISKKYGNINSAECPFPGSKNVRTISSVTSPAMLAWDGSSAKVSLSHITENLSDGSITFMTMNDTIITSDEPDIPTEKNVVYKESFETNVDNIVASSIVGKEIWRTYKKGNFVINAELIPEATDGKRLFMLYLGKNNMICESEAVSPNIDVVAGKDYTLSFDISSYNVPDKLTPQFELFIEDNYGEYLVYSSNKIGVKWENVEIPLRFASNEFHYKLRGSLLSGGIFIDNIQLYEANSVTSINLSENSIDKGYEMHVYLLDGTCIGLKRISDLDNMPSGIYILRNKKGVKKIMK